MGSVERFMAGCVLLIGVACTSTPRAELAVDWVETLDQANAILAQARDGESASLARDRLVALEQADMRPIRARSGGLSPATAEPLSSELRARLAAEQQRFVLAVHRVLGYGREVPEQVRLDLQRLLPVFTGEPD